MNHLKIVVCTSSIICYRTTQIVLRFFLSIIIFTGDGFFELLSHERIVKKTRNWTSMLNLLGKI